MADETYDPERCPPCRGTGVVRSNRGGTPHDVECPWCGGTGRRQPGRNAQEFAPEAAGGGDAADAS
jgi:DnaJ-class molecular chaperone